MTSSTFAPAGLLAQGDEVAPIPGTKRLSRVEENTAVGGTRSEAQAQMLER
ncbi:hypothetical protein ACGFZK_03415 [Streptomyces sp. NPDC048257]|uniref:hypothetical protein n=1 Tax=Streptomyces sp. NPDC048257 TaxID=3365526 RepID=UPI003723F1B9